MAQFAAVPTTIAEFQSYLGYNAAATDGYFIVPIPGAYNVSPNFDLGTGTVETYTVAGELYTGLYNLVTGDVYKITSLGTTSQAIWNFLAGTTGITYAVNSTFTFALAGSIYPSEEYVDLFGFIQSLSATGVTTFVASGVHGAEVLTATTAQTISAGVPITGPGVVGNTVVPAAVTASTTIPLDVALVDNETSQTYTLHNNAVTGVDYDISKNLAIFIGNVVNFSAGVTAAGGTQLLV